MTKAHKKAMKKKRGAVVEVNRYIPVLPEADGKYYQVHVSDGKNDWIEGDGIIDDNGVEDIYTVKAARRMRRTVASRLRKKRSSGKYYIQIVVWADGMC